VIPLVQCNICMRGITFLAHPVHCIVVSGGPRRGQIQHVQDISWRLDISFWDMRADKQTYIRMQTDRQTDSQTRWWPYAILCTPSTAK